VGATWIELVKFKQLYPSLKLADELVVQGGERCYVRYSIYLPSKEGNQQQQATNQRVLKRI
jgi:hypothetical protein